MTTDIETYESGLEVERHNALANRFNPFMVDVQRLVKTAQSIKVASPEDVKAMKLARTTRLALKNIRVDVEKTRKNLKEASLREGKAVDGMANIIKYIVAPVEKDLQAKEDFVRLAEQKRIVALSEDRKMQLELLDVECEHFALGEMPETAFDALLNSSALAHKAKKDAEEAERQRLEGIRLAAEKAEAERKEAERVERERIEAENAELRKKADKEEAARKKEEAEKRNAVEEIAKLQREKEAKEKADKEAEQARERQEHERKAAEEKAAKDAELAKIKAEKEAEQAKLAAPDKEKLQQLVDDICKLTIPSVSSNIALDAVKGVRAILNNAVKGLRGSITEMEKE